MVSKRMLSSVIGKLTFGERSRWISALFGLGIVGTAIAAGRREQADPLTNEVHGSKFDDADRDETTPVHGLSPLQIPYDEFAQDNFDAPTASEGLRTALDELIQATQEIEVTAGEDQQVIRMAQAGVTTTLDAASQAAETSGVSTLAIVGGVALAAAAISAAGGGDSSGAAPVPTPAPTPCLLYTSPSPRD